jgi:predicted DNA binding CopG/RHH family protein
MNIGALDGFSPVNGAQAATASAGSGRAQAPLVGEESGQQVSENLSGQLPPAEKNSSPADQLPQDVVEVHQDSEIKNQIIVEYLDKARNVILQVPSSEELAVERAIAQELEQAAKLRANQAISAAAATKGEETHGD